MSQIYPPIKPFHTERLDVGGGHELHVEHSGNPDGIPVLYLHGGPGAGLAPVYRSLFDPDKFWIIGFDQRGSGLSTPFASTKNNTTNDLLDDIQKLRVHLKIKRWMLCGGSWGATLALLSAIQHPKQVTGIILRGTFLARQTDFDWFLNADGGAAQIFPEHYASFSKVAREFEPELSLDKAYQKIFSGDNELAKAAATKAWCMWEERIATMNSSIIEQDLTTILHRATSLARLESHYIEHKCFIEENFILDNVHHINTIPGTIIHGRYDMVCKMEAAHSLRKKWRNSQLLIVPESGHSVSDPKIAEAVCHASDAMARFIKEER